MHHMVLWGKLVQPLLLLQLRQRPRSRLEALRPAARRCAARGDGGQALWEGDAVMFGAPLAARVALPRAGLLLLLAGRRHLPPPPAQEDHGHAGRCDQRKHAPRHTGCNNNDAAAAAPKARVAASCPP